MNNIILFIDVQKDKFTKSFTSIPLAWIRLKRSCAAVNLLHLDWINDHSFEWTIHYGRSQNGAPQIAYAHVNSRGSSSKMRPLLLSTTNWMLSNCHSCLAYHIVLKISVVVGLFANLVALTIGGLIDEQSHLGCPRSRPPSWLPR
jgi:hypothetical protein